MDSLEIAKMSKVERLQAMEAIWDSLIHENTEVEYPGWHEGDLATRKKHIEAGNAEFRTIEALRSKQRK